MATLAPGAQFGEYLIERELARGGMGVVYKATRIRTGQAIALKCIAPERAAEPSYRDRFVREANVLVGLQHPRIVPLIDWGDVDGVLYLALAYLDGPDLEVLIERDGPFSLGRTIELLAPIAEALDAAHRRGYIHRDVKPANIMLDADGNVYLTDFGLGKLAGSSGLSATNTAIGTLAYMSPEQFTGKLADPSLASRTDIYALGCVFHACLTRQETVPTDNFVRAMHAVLTEPPPRLSAVRPSLPAALDEVEARALAKDPAERYERATAFIAAARAVLAAHPDPEPAAQVLLPPPPGARRDLPPDPGPPAMTEVAPAVAATVVASHAGAGPPAGAAAPPIAPGPPPPAWAATGPAPQHAAPRQGMSSRTLAIVGGGIVAVVILVAAFLAIGGRGQPGPTPGTGAAPSAVGQQETPSIRPTPTRASAPASAGNVGGPTRAPSASGSFVTFGDGTWVVGTDIEPGTYRLREPGEFCFWERHRTVRSEDLTVANAIAIGYAVVSIFPEDTSFVASDCPTWSSDLSQVTASTSRIGQGTFIVGTDLVPGTYESEGGQDCYWARLSDFTGEDTGIVANDIPEGPASVTIDEGDVGFSTVRCGDWVRR